MLPNLSLPIIDIYGVLKIDPFGVFVIIAAFTGCELACRRVRYTGLDVKIMIGCLPWVVVSGLVSSHLVSAFFYYPDRIFKNPLTLLIYWKSLSSFGGFFGGILGALFYFRKNNIASIPYIECMLFGFIPSWVIGRLGCTFAFDHPGQPTDFLLGMMDGYGVVRHNLGFYEMLVALVLMVVFYQLRNCQFFKGFFIFLTILLYMPVRIFLDSLRVGEVTYWGMTIGQYFAFATLGLTSFVIVWGLVKNLGGKANSTLR